MMRRASSDVCKPAYGYAKHERANDSPGLRPSGTEEQMVACLFDGRGDLHLFTFAYRDFKLLYRFDG